MTPVPGFESPPVKRVVGFPDGGFAVLSASPYHSSANGLRAYDRRGRLLWARLERTSFARS